ncbi:MAG: hypothetical protein ACK58T_35545 [Phycisphaerae bacterium]
MTPLEIVLLIAMALCAITLTMTVINLGVYRRPRSPPSASEIGATITVCVPARN